MVNNYSLEARERKVRRKALEAGYRVSKGFQHYHNGSIVTNWNGERFTGYVVEDLATGYLVWGCYDANFDHLWTLEDAEEFIKGKYEKAGIKY